MPSTAAAPGRGRRPLRRRRSACAAAAVVALSSTSGPPSITANARAVASRPAGGGAAASAAALAPGGAAAIVVGDMRGVSSPPPRQSSVVAAIAFADFPHEVVGAAGLEHRRRGVTVRRMEHSLKAVADVMRPGVLSVSESSSLRAVAQVMHEHRVHGVLVVADDGELLGWVTARGLLAHRDEDWRRIKAGKSIGEPCVRVAPSVTVSSAIETMARHGRHAPRRHTSGQPHARRRRVTPRPRRVPRALISPAAAGPAAPAGRRCARSPRPRCPARRPPRASARGCR